LAFCVTVNVSGYNDNNDDDNDAGNGSNDNCDDSNDKSATNG